MFFVPKFSGKNPECKEINGTTFTDGPPDLLFSLACNLLVLFWFSLCVSISKRPVSHAVSIRMIISCLGLDSSLRVTYCIMETMPTYLIALQSNCAYLFINHWNTFCNFMKNQMYTSISLKWLWNFTGSIFAQIWCWQLQETDMGHCCFSLNIAILQSFLCTKAMVLGIRWVEG